MAMAICPSCEGEIKLTQKIELGQKIRCPHCFEDLEVIETSPIELDWAYEEEEDWDDDDWDDDWDDDDEEEEEEEKEDDGDDW